MQENLLVAQSGGPTSAINATLVGILQSAKSSGKIGHVWGSHYGIEGVLNDDFLLLDQLTDNPAALRELYYTPASALGSCRYKLNDFQQNPAAYEKIVRTLKQRHITCFIYIGGNDSMDTVQKLSAYLQSRHISDIQIVGAPKTIDNDLVQTDHCPGFGSAAKFVAAAFSELERDLSSYSNAGVLIVEVMGRNTGWLTAASALPRMNNPNGGPDFIYVCEKAFSVDAFIRDVKRRYEEKSRVIVAVSEGLKDRSGLYIAQQFHRNTADRFGHAYIAGVGQTLERLVRAEIGCKVRSIELNLLQRCAGHIASGTDLNESCALGQKALQCALDGHGGEMACLIRQSDDPYRVRYSSVPVGLVANAEKKVPNGWIVPQGNDVTPQMVEYLKPLIIGEPDVRYKNGIPVQSLLG